MAGGTVVGLDIGSSMMKVVELKRSGSGVEITALGVAPTPQEAVENSIILDSQMLGQAVKALLSQTGVTAKKCVSSVSGQSAVVVRVIDVPQMSDDELANAIKWEVERVVPFPLSDVILDYKVIDRPEGYAEGQNVDVVFAVAQQDLVDLHVQALQAAGLSPEAIDVEPLAVSRALLELQSNDTPGYTAVIINIGASVTDIGVFRDKLPTFLRTLPLAGNNLTQAVADYLQVDFSTAERYKTEYGEVVFDQVPQAAEPFGIDGGFGGGSAAFMDFSPPPAAAEPVPDRPSDSGRMPFDFSTPGESHAAPLPFEPTEPNSGSLEQESPFGMSGSPEAAALPTPNLPAVSAIEPNTDAMRMQVFSAIAPVLAELVQELRRSIDYYCGKSVDSHIHELLIVGGTARLKGIAQYLEVEVGIPARVADPLANIQVTSKNFSGQHLHDISAMFPISIGLGARDLIAGPVSTGKKSKRK